MLTTKDLGQFLTAGPLAASLRFVPVPGDSPSHDPQASAATAGLLGPGRRGRSVTDAVRAIIAEEAPPYDILICGSLYLAGDVLRGHG